MNSGPSEKLLNAIKNANPTSQSIFLGFMTSPTSVSIGTLVLSESDLYIAEHLSTGFVVSHENDIVTTARGLESGDRVLVVKINDEKFAVVERLV